MALVILQVVNRLLDWGREQRDLTAGEQKAIAAAGQEVMRKSEVGREILARVESLSDDDLDRGLRDLEPKSESIPPSQ